jgi:two-component system, OmpR family, phosphate regulon sensor histidine kinase PhoR
MLLAIVALVSFQSYWLNKNFGEEKRNLRFHTNVLFRESLQRLQAEKLHLDTNVRVRFTARYEAINVLGTLQDKIKDTSYHRVPDNTRAEIIISKDGNFNYRKDSLEATWTNDSLRKVRLMNGGLIKILRGVDSLRDTITTKEASTRYAQLLQRENINIPFIITRTPLVFSEDRFPHDPDPEHDNEVTIGFEKPVSYKVELGNTTWYVLRKMSTQIWVSFLLVGLTIFSFLLLLRNLVQQRKLTQLKNDFISNITHELKTPIATVSVAVEAMRNFNALDDPNRTREYLDISSIELQRLSLLVDKVLKLSMFEKQQIELREEVVDLHQLVEEIVSSMKLQFEKYRAHVSVHLHGKDFLIKADRLHVTSVIYNLLDNALKYSKANPSIQVDLSEAPDTVEISITDNGIGILPEYQKKIFDKFFRVPTGDTHNVKGYGLGLSYVAYVIKRHNGSINMESQPGIGSRFTIKLLKTT